MAPEPIISVSGLRGIVGESLTEEVARRYATAFAEELPAGPVVIGRDGRASGAMFAEVIGAAIAATGGGRRVFDAGPASTPTVGVLVRDLKAAGGVQISASHNPPQYNGIKLFSAEGRVIPAVAGQRVLDRYRASSAAAGQRPAGAAPTEDRTTHGHHQRPPSSHRANLQRRPHPQQAIPRVARRESRRRRVLGKVLLDHLGCESIILGATPDGAFAHTPEPTEANLAGVLKEVVERQAAIGFCQDPDADRLAIIDERGRYIGEEKTPALCVEHVLRSGLRGPIVTNCSTSRMSEDLAAKYGVPFFRSKVGEANVVDMMLEQGALLGAEGNGGIIDPRVGLVRDSFVGMALVLDAMAARDMPVSAAGRRIAGVCDSQDDDRRAECGDSGGAGEAGAAFRRRGDRYARRVAARLAQRGVAAGAAEQYGADRAGDRRGADAGRSARLVRGGGAGDYARERRAWRCGDVRASEVACPSRGRR